MDVLAEERRPLRTPAARQAHNNSCVSRRLTLRESDGVFELSDVRPERLEWKTLKLEFSPFASMLRRGAEV
jgi:hypothetical protein